MLISPSLLAANPLNLGAAAGAVPNADYIHVDIMDGRFVPRLSWGLDVVAALRQEIDLPIDCHLMVQDPLHWAPRFAAAGAHSVTFHAETLQPPDRVAQAIREAGARVGMALAPRTPWSGFDSILPVLDSVVVMTVEPGSKGQGLNKLMLAKVRSVRSAVRSAQANVRVQVDGGVNLENIESCARAGADVFVSGEGIFGQKDPNHAVELLREAAAAATQS